MHPMARQQKKPAAKRLTHLDDSGNARMVDVAKKPVSSRVAVAEGFITVDPDTLKAISRGNVPKGDVFACARIAAIQAAKRCDVLIPLCHTLPLDQVDVSFKATDEGSGRSRSARIRIQASVSVTARTGVEMEALTAVAIAALTIYDMCKAIDKSMRIGDIRLVSKTKNQLD